MKIRNGFVSNSSSSSFVVAFDREIKNDAESVAYLKEILYGDTESDRYWGDIISTNVLCEIIARDLKPDSRVSESRKSGFDEILKVYAESGYDAALVLYDAKIESSQEYEWDASYIEPEERLEIKQFISDNPRKFIYRCEFSDNDGNFYSHLEHGGTFSTVPHKSFSHH